MVKVVLNNEVQDTEPWLWEVAVLMIYFPISSPRRKMTSSVIFEAYSVVCLNFWQVTIKNDDYQPTKIQYLEQCFIWGHTNNEDVILLLLMH